MKKHEVELLMDLQRLIGEMSADDASAQTFRSATDDPSRFPEIKVSGIGRKHSTFRVSYTLKGQAS